MTLLCLLVLLTGIFPLSQAWRTHRHTSLSQAVIWASAAWFGWVGLLLAELGGEKLFAGLLRYTALCLIGCAGVAVLGARRPGVGAWNFVVLGLLAVLLLFWAEGFLAGGEVKLGELRSFFLASTLGVGILNYLPTRRAPAALLLALGCMIEIGRLIDPTHTARWLTDTGPTTEWLFALVPWLAWLGLPSRTTANYPIDRLWRDFRDAYGLVWAQRVREQFNRSAEHAGWPVELSWPGLRPIPPAALDQATAAASLATLQALLKRFGPEMDDTV